MNLSGCNPVHETLWMNLSGCIIPMSWKKIHLPYLLGPLRDQGPRRWLRRLIALLRTKKVNKSYLAKPPLPQPPSFTQLPPTIASLVMSLCDFMIYMLNMQHLLSFLFKICFSFISNQSSVYKNQFPFYLMIPLFLWTSWLLRCVNPKQIRNHPAYWCVISRARKWWIWGHSATSVWPIYLSIYLSIYPETAIHLCIPNNYSDSD